MGTKSGSSWLTTLRLATIMLLLLLANAPAEAMAASDGLLVISIKDFSYSPKEATILAGATVTWVNQGKERHTVTSMERHGSSGHGSHNFAIDSDDLKPGQSYSLRFDVPGTYSYICKRHKEQMAASITVVAPSSAPNPAPIPPNTLPATPPPVSKPAPPASTRPAAPPAATQPAAPSAATPTAAPPAANPNPALASGIALGDDFFRPTSLTVSSGATVTWTNNGSSPHTVTSDTGLWDSGMLRTGQVFSFTFQNPGAYAYNCAFHGGMVGKITVTGAAPGASPSPAPTSPPAGSGPGIPGPSPSPAAPPAASPAPPPVATPAPTQPPAATPAPAPQSGNSISLGDDFFAPVSLAVFPGAQVIWTNNGRHPHTVTSDTGLWDSGMLSTGQGFSFTFQNPGTYAYNCAFHGGMVGVITVTGAAPDASPSPTPTSPPAGSGPGIPGSSPSPEAPPSASPEPPPVATPAPTQPPAATPAPAPQSGNGISLGDDFFAPVSLAVFPGAQVIWTNNGRHPHTVTSDTGIWDSGMLGTGQGFSFTFQNPGTYAYNCAFHGGMVGIVVVSGGGASPSPIPVAATPSPTPVPSPTLTPVSNPIPAPPSGGNSVSLGDDFFSPGSLAVSPGATVTWTNTGGRPHTTTSDNGLWDSGMLRPGQSFSFTFQNSGEYTYNCAFHGGMVGTIVVSTAGLLESPSPTPAAPGPTSTPVAPVMPVSAAALVSAVADASEITAGDNFFSAPSLTVSPGATVTWINSGRTIHVVASDTGLWDSGMLSSGQSFSFTLPKPGVYGYSCPLHEGMVGAVVVVGSPGQPLEDVPAEASQSGSVATSGDGAGLAAPAAVDAPSSPKSSTVAEPSASTISMLDNSFSPEPVTVSVGTTVTWTNDGRAPHTSTSKEGLWDSGLMKAGQSFSVRLDKPGLYEYFCIFHPDMVGSLKVQGSEVSAALSLAPAAGAADTVRQPAEPVVLLARAPGTSVLAPASGGNSSRPEAGTGAAPLTVNVVVPGPSSFEIMALMAAMGAMVTSLFNLFMIVRPRR